MATLTVKNIPDPVVDRLKQQARLTITPESEPGGHRVPRGCGRVQSGRSRRRSWPEIRSLRVRPKGVRLTDSLLTQLKAAGRP